MPKLTLSVDEKVVRSAKRYAAAQGTSVSRLVERYLDLLSRPFDMAKAPPVLRMLRGAARGVPAGAHRKHLDDESLTFVVRVQKIGEGPTHIKSLIPLN